MDILASLSLRLELEHEIDFILRRTQIDDD
jgi:hypothetical protein